MQELVQGAAVHELHHEKREALFEPEIEHLDHVRVTHLRRRASLPQEALHGPLAAEVLDRRRAENLESDATSKPAVLRFEDGPHRPLAYQTQNLVGAESSPWA